MDATKKRFIYKPSNATKAGPNSKPSYPINNRPISNSYLQDREQSAMAAFRNQKRNLATSEHDNKALESPAKKSKLPEQGGRNDDLEFELGDFDDIEDDDFSKGLTSDDLTILEMRASQTVNVANARQDGKNGNFSALHQLDKFLTEKTSSSKIIPEKTLDLFSTEKIESSTIICESKINNNFDVQHLKQLENELAEYTIRIKKMEEHAFSKDGEIKILRQGLAKAQEERDGYKSKIHNIKGNLSEKQSENEKKLQREVEKLTTQLQFKEKEVREAKQARTRTEQDKESSSGSPTNRQHLMKKKSPKVSPLMNLSFDENNPLNRPSTSLTRNKTDKKGPSSDVISKEKESSSKNIDDFVTDVEKRYFGVERLKTYSQDYSHIQRDLLEDFDKAFKRIQKMYIETEEDKNNKKTKSQRNYHPLVMDLLSLCSKTIQIQGETNIFSILEIIEPLIMRLSSNSKAMQGAAVNLLCDEEMPSSSLQPMEENEKNQQCLSMDDLGSNELGRISLFILNTVTKHSNAVQESLLLALLEDQSNDISTEMMENQERILGSDHFQAFSELSPCLLMKVDADSSKSSSERKLFKMQHQLQFYRNSERSSENLVKCLFDLFNQEQSDDSIKNQLFQIVVSLATSTTAVSKSGLLKKLGECQTLNIMSRNFDKDCILSLVSIIKNLSVYPGIKDLLCSTEGVCTLQNIYKALTQLSCGCPDRDSDDLMLEIIQTISTLIASQNGMMKFLLESECQCSCEILKSLVIVLLNEAKVVRENCLEQIENNTLDDCKQFLILRQGISLLCHICLNDRLFMDHRIEVERQYINLINATIRLFRKIPSISEFEVIALQDLLDMEHYEDLDDIDEDPCLEAAMETE